MKKAIPVVILIFLGLSVLGSSNNQIKYRIQCATSADKELLSELHKIPELTKFTLPSGSKIFFSGAYFDKYETAEERLKTVHESGFKSAFIRVFKHNSMLSKPVGDRYIAAMKLKVVTAVVKKDTVENTVFIAKPKVKKVYTRAEVDALKKKAAERKEKERKEEELALEKIRKEKEQKAKEEEAAEAARNKKDEVKDENVVDEPPVYKILVATTTLKAEEPKLVSKLVGEIVYTYEERSKKMYTVGFYGNEAAAQNDLNKYKKLSRGDAKVIGVFKGRIVSLKLANQLYAQFNNQNN